MVLASLMEVVLALSLYAARVGGVMMATPGLDTVEAPKPVKALLVLALGAALWVAMGEGQWRGADPVLVAAAVPLEFALGVALGFVVRLILATIEMAGEFMSFQMGFAAAAAFDPSTGSSISPPTRLLTWTSVALFFAIDGHHQVLLALADSYRSVPLGAAGLTSINAEGFLVMVGGMFEAAVQLAFPIIFVMLVINAAMGAIARFAPQVNVLMIGFILTMGVGLLAMADLMPSLGTAIIVALEQYDASSVVALPR